MHVTAAAGGDRRPRSLLLAALALAAVTVGLRVIGLGRESLWLDEGATWELARRPVHELLAAARADVHPPLFFLLVRFASRLGGASEAVLRLVPAIASILTVPLAARLAWRAYGPRAAWGAAVLVALSAYQVCYAQEARPYALLGLLALASAEALLAVLERGTPGARVAFVVATVALLYAHAHALFVVLAEALAVGWTLRAPEGRRAARALLVPAAIVLVAFAPWTGALLSQVARVSSGFWLARPAPIELARTLAAFAGSTPLLVLLGPLALAGLVRPARPAAPGRTPARALVVLLACVPLLVPFALSYAGPPIFLARAAIAASLALALLAAAGWAALPRNMIAVAGTLAVLACAPPLLDAHRLTYKEPWRDAVRWLANTSRPGDLVLVTAPYYRKGVFAYYEGGTASPDVLAFPAHGGPVSVADVAALAPQLARHRRAWLVRARADDPQALLEPALAAGRRVTVQREWSVAAMPPSRPRPVRAIEIICYAAPDSSPPTAPSRPASGR